MVPITGCVGFPGPSYNTSYLRNFSVKGKPVSYICYNQNVEKINVVVDFCRKFFFVKITECIFDAADAYGRATPGDYPISNSHYISFMK
jgi:hypothetical protein